MKQSCFFISTSWSNSANSIAFQNLSKSLVDKGHMVVLIVDGRKKHVEGEFGKLKVYTWPSKRPTKLADFYFLYKLIKKYHPICLISNFGSVNMMTIVGWLLNVPSRCSWYRTLSTQVITKSNWQTLRKTTIYKLCTHIIANSHAAKRDLEKVYKVPENKCTVFYNSLPDPLKDTTLELSTTNKDLIICVGRFHETKGQEVLIKAMAIVNRLSQVLDYLFLAVDM